MHSITIQCNALLYTTLQNTIEAMHTGNDFTYTSVTDIIRAALTAYQEGMELIEIDRGGKKKQTSILVDDSLYKFYKSLPNQLRSPVGQKARGRCFWLRSISNRVRNISNLKKKNYGFQNRCGL